ncbi:hypothetical protein HDU96_000571, partial [Phlyctochytrium bullatum]
ESAPVATMETHELVTIIFLSISIPLGLHNLILCFLLALQKKTVLHYLQTLASLFQLADQTCFLVIYCGSASRLFNNDCSRFVTFADFTFYLFFPTSVGILIWRTTGLLNAKARPYIRALFFLVLAAAMSCIWYAASKRIDLVIVDRCVSLYLRYYNTIGKIIIFVLYICLMLCFVVPAVSHLQTSSKLGLHKSTLHGAKTGSGANASTASGLGRSSVHAAQSAPARSKHHTETGVATTTTSSHSAGAAAPAAPLTTAELLRRIVMSVTLRIVLAITGFLITVVLSFCGVWDRTGTFFIEFTIQKFMAITASTFDVVDPSARRKMSSAARTAVASWTVPMGRISGTKTEKTKTVDGGERDGSMRKEGEKGLEGSGAVKVRDLEAGSA